MIGAGACGILASLALHRQGEAVLLVDATGLAAGQTGHCHGYLHRGFIYNRPALHEVRALNEGHAWWCDRQSGSESASESIIAFDDEHALRVATAEWAHVGLPEPRTLSGSNFAVSKYAMRVPEHSIVPTDVLRRLWEGTPSVPKTILARVEQFNAGDEHQRPRSASTAVLRTGRNTVNVAARRWLIAAGAGAPMLLAGTAPSPPVENRLSFMIVVETQARLPKAFCIRSPSAQGLFGCARPATGGRTKFLISDYFSASLEVDTSLVRAMWLRHIAEVITAELPELWNDPTARWGIYKAAKSQARRRANGAIPSGVIAKIASDCHLIESGKLTTAPVFVNTLLHTLATANSRGDALKGATSPDVDLLDMAKPLKWAPEQWTHIPLVDRDTLFYPDVRAVDRHSGTRGRSS